MKADERDCRVTPESLLTAEDVKAMIREAENERDKALIFVLFEAALRPRELLTSPYQNDSRNTRGKGI